MWFVHIVFTPWKKQKTPINTIEKPKLCCMVSRNNDRREKHKVESKILNVLKRGATKMHLFNHLYLYLQNIYHLYTESLHFLPLTTCGLMTEIVVLWFTSELILTTKLSLVGFIIVHLIKAAFISCWTTGVVTAALIFLGKIINLLQMFALQ